MGREVRRVPENWQHPKDAKGNWIPQFDEVYETAIADWLSQAKLWEKGKHPNQDENFRDYVERHELDPNMSFLEWHGSPPGPPGERGGAAYLTEVDRPWWQMYENVSEGTPISPPFDSKEKLIDWIIVSLGHSRSAAERFVSDGYAPSFVMTDGEIKMNLNAFEEEKGNQP